MDSSIRRVFAGRTGSPEADRLRETLLPGDRMVWSDLYTEVFNKHIPAMRIRAAVGLLVNMGELRVLREPTNGRDARVLWRRPSGGWPTESESEAAADAL